MFRPDPRVLDGRFANNGWLQELPKPYTKVAWDNPLLISPETATSLGLESEDMVDVVYRGRQVRMAVWVTPGHPNNAATVYLGYGRTRAGRVGDGTGFNTYGIWTSDATGHGTGAQIQKTGDSYKLSNVQSHDSMEGRDWSVKEHLPHIKDPKSVQHEHDHMQLPTLYPEYKYEGYAWGMAIDLNSCIGCNACVVACQAENNIPVVGKEQVRNGREMHWIRIDRYYAGDAGRTRTIVLPAGAVHALRERAVRTGLPGRRRRFTATKA